MIGALALLAVSVAVVAVAGFVVGRMIAGRIDRWQVSGHEPADPDRAGKEQGDDPDSA